MSDDNERTLLRKLIDEHCRALAAQPPVEVPEPDVFTGQIDDADAEKLASAILDDHRFARLRATPHNLEQLLAGWFACIDEVRVVSALDGLAVTLCEDDMGGIWSGNGEEFAALIARSIEGGA